MMADMVMRNGRIYTMDEGFTVAEAIAIKDGEILWTGDGADAGRFISKDTKVVDLGGKTVLPGLIDMHVHVPGNAYNALHNIDVYDAKTAEETEEIIRDFIKTHPEKDVYYGKGFKTALFPGDEKIKGPRKERLDAICSDKPIGIIDEGGHVIWLNSKGLEEAGITGTTEDIPGGVIEKDAQGNLWGILKDEAKKLFKEQQFSREEKIQAYQWFQDLMNSYG
ncbi:MAG: amidohydrolase family protein, partial [Anaerovoracaceae bacterium]